MYGMMIDYKNIQHFIPSYCVLLATLCRNSFVIFILLIFLQMRKRFKEAVGSHL